MDFGPQPEVETANYNGENGQSWHEWQKKINTAIGFNGPSRTRK